MAEQQHPINQMIETAIAKLKNMAQTETVVGAPIELSNGQTAVPICKVTVGFGSGGMDLPGRANPAGFGGGAGGGVSVTPIAFLVTHKDEVKLIQLDTIGSTADNIVRAVPDVIDKVADLFQKDNKENP